jgi:hypothetical protein
VVCSDARFVLLQARRPVVLCAAGGENVFALDFLEIKKEIIIVFSGHFFLIFNFLILVGITPFVAMVNDILINEGRTRFDDVCFFLFGFSRL